MRKPEPLAASAKHGQAADAGEAAATFRPLRPRLFGIAYRMLGSDAYLRWHETDIATIRDPSAFLSTVVTRLSLDHLKSARVRRETYVGPWLPEPILDGSHADAPDQMADRHDVSVALILALERLSPLERAAFLLHDIFGLSFDEVAAALDREVPACRQLAARARKNVRAARPRFAVTPSEGMRIADAFFEASRSGDHAALRALLADGVVVYADGGGRKPAALNPIRGLAKVTALFVGLARKVDLGKSHLLHRGLINALPGFVTIEAGEVLQTTALEIDAGKITAIYVVRNPEKLRHLSQRFEGRA
jgi:RNA polymerase sigma-70 factor (ECF subfamily)